MPLAAGTNCGVFCRILAQNADRLGSCSRRAEKDFEM
jgi:hypothetical protein